MKKFLTSKIGNILLCIAEIITCISSSSSSSNSMYIIFSDIW